MRLTPGEVVKADGTIERGTMGGAHRGSAWWSYTKATDGEETWFPQFYYVGSRYVYAELVPAATSARKVQGAVVLVRRSSRYDVAPVTGDHVRSILSTGTLPVGPENVATSASFAATPAE